MILNGINGKDGKVITFPRGINIPDNINTENDSNFYFIIMQAITEAWQEDVNTLEDKYHTLLEAQIRKRD